MPKGWAKRDTARYIISDKEERSGFYSIIAGDARDPSIHP
jgi:hypothetical protein